MKTRIFSVGGSIIVPDTVDYIFLKRFKKLILQLAKKEKVIIITGGGKTARNYIQALEKEGASRYKQCIVGIACTHLNAKLLATFLGLKQSIPTNTRELLHAHKQNRIVVSGGGLEKFEVGSTSDGTTAAIAARLCLREMINLTNVNGVYNKNPQKYRNAKLIKHISYKEFEKLMLKVKEKPGQHFILDSLAARIVKQNCIKVAILNGRNLRNLQAYLSGRKFVGSVIG